MGADVTIKANSHGIVVVTDSSLSYDNMVSAVKSKFKQCKNIFGDSCNMPVTIKGPSLTEEEYRRLLEQLNHIDGINTHFTEGKKEAIAVSATKNPASISPSDKLKTAEKAICRPAAPEISGNYIFKGTLKSGEELSIKNSVIIMGDVEKDASVISGGNIIVLGNLMGRAIAGKTKSASRFILALYMKPEYIQIGNISHTFSKQSNKKNTTDEAAIAYKSGSTILIEHVSQETAISKIF